MLPRIETPLSGREKTRILRALTLHLKVCQNNEVEFAEVVEEYGSSEGRFALGSERGSLISTLLNDLVALGYLKKIRRGKFRVIRAITGEDISAFCEA